MSTTRVELHCHSALSDGILPPAVLAERLASGGVAFAALTDHDTLDGLDAFRSRLARLGVGFITGVEITVECAGREAHLLAYGFNPAHTGLRQALAALRQARPTHVDSIAGTLRRRGDNPGDAPPLQAAGGRLNISAAIALVHSAGGRAFLAHPQLYEPDFARLEPVVRSLKDAGLDGIEALHGLLTPADQDALCALADKLGLAVSAGTDLHVIDSPAACAGIAMPTARWKAFRDTVCARGAGQLTHAAGVSPAPSARRRPVGSVALRIVLPTLLAIGLFVTAMFAVFIPAFERSLLDRKREMIRELVNSAWSILSEAEQEERQGLMPREQAQGMARNRIEAMRYGREGKDYFWLQDMQPRIVMHPYRKDLNGQDVSGFRDARGNHIFVEFADLVRRHGEGYIEYVWQWKDDPGRLEPKESYVRGFAPWGWIIGTGIYVEDVKHEIARIERNLVRIDVAILVIVALLLLYVVRQSLRLERERAEAEDGLHESTQHYRSLVEAATEGTLLVLDGRCRYANPMLLRTLGYTEREIELLDPSDLLPDIAGNETAWAHVQRLAAGEEPPGGFEVLLRRRDATLVECVGALSPFALGGRKGFILLARDVSPRTGGPADDATKGPETPTLAHLAADADVPLFRARAQRRAVVLEMNAAASRLLGSSGQPALADLFQESRDYEKWRDALERDGRATAQIRTPGQNGPSRVLQLQASLLHDDQGAPRFIDGYLLDVTAAAGRETERESLIERLQTALLFLHEPVGRLAQEPVFCLPDTPLRKAAALMTAADLSAVLVRSGSGTVLGIVTDATLRTGAVGAGLDARESVDRVMTAPVLSVPRHMQVYEALILMQEKSVQHLAVTDDTGHITGLLRSRDILRLHSYGSIVLTREIAASGSTDEVIRWCQRMPALVKALIDCGAGPRSVARMITSVCDAATVRFLSLAAEDLGRAPAPFAFLALGSQGRQEQTLFTDQDNAIVFVPADETDPGEAARYFTELGRRVCAWLNQAGFSYCRGNVMAMNPRWVQPLAIWKDYFSNWIARAEPQELLEFSIFFDFRTVSGDDGPAHELRQHVAAALHARPAFFPLFARNSLSFRPPPTLFGRRLPLGGAAGDQLNLKDALMPIVSFARLYALRHDLDETHTLDRLEALVERGHLAPSTCSEIAAAYDFLMRLRLKNQSGIIHVGGTPDNTVSRRRLNHLDQALLQQAFAQLRAVQQKISYEFLAGT
jgi:PAS domain S-box-containing protein